MAPPSLSPTAPKQGMLRARVDIHVEEAFAALAKQRGIKTSDLLRSLVLAEVGAGGPPIGHVKPEPENSEVNELRVRLPAFLFDAAKARAKMRGMPPGRWAAALVQSNLSRHPFLNDDEINSVNMTNRELAAVNRNINQIALRLNEAFYDTERVRIDSLAELTNNIVRTRNVIRVLVRTSRQGWELDEP